MPQLQAFLAYELQKHPFICCEEEIWCLGVGGKEKMPGKAAEVWLSFRPFRSIKPNNQILTKEGTYATFC